MREGLTGDERGSAQTKRITRNDECVSGQFDLDDEMHSTETRVQPLTAFDRCRDSFAREHTPVSHSQSALISVRRQPEPAHEAQRNTRR